MININKYKNLVLIIAKKIGPENLGKTKLYKLLFYIDITSYKEIGNSITGDVYLKYPFGPVPKCAWDIINKLVEEGSLEVKMKNNISYIMTLFKTIKDPDLSYFEEREKQCILKVIRELGPKTRDQLIRMSHSEKEWKNAKNRSTIIFDRNKIKIEDPERIPKDISAKRFVESYKSDLKRLGDE